MAVTTGTTNFTKPYGGSSFDAILKDFYEGPIRDHINNKVTVLELTEKSSRKFSGKRVVFPVHLSRNEGIGARGEGGTLPSAGEQGYQESTIQAKFLYGRISLSGVVMSASSGDKGAFAEALKQEVSGVRKDLRNDLNRQTWGIPIVAGDGAGNSGALATVTAEEDATVTFSNDDGVRYLKAGMKVVVGTPGASTLGTAVATSVSSVDTANKQVTFVDDVNSLVGDVVVRGEGTADGNNAYGEEITGLSTIVHDDDDIDLQNIDVSANTEFKAKRFTSDNNRDLSLELMQLAYDACDEIGGEEPEVIIGHHSMRREYINLLQADVRYSPEALKGGHQTLTYAGGTRPTTIRFDKHAPYHKLYFLRLSDIKQYVMQDWKWADKDGAILARESAKDQWEAFMCWYGNLGVEVRNTHAVIEDLNASNLIF